ncbi:unnamed protein product [Jaminaea pallidilutea]
MLSGTSSASTLSHVSANSSSSSSRTQRTPPGTSKRQSRNAATLAGASATPSTSLPSPLKDPDGAWDELPRPYEGHSSPFPLPVGKRSLAGLAALDEKAGAEGYSKLPGNGRRAQPAALGKTRCYWAILSYHATEHDPHDLTFLYCDPVLQSHLGTEAELMNGKSFFDWVHPLERERARSDLRKIISSRTLFGSVTRCRYYRVPAIRKHLGCDNPPTAEEAHMYVEDDRFLPIDIVLSMVGESVALCFFHAIINKSIQDNSEASKTDWTNWCGSRKELFDAEECDKIWTSVQSAKVQKERSFEPQVSPSHVFQILSMPTAPNPDTDDLPIQDTPEVLFSWPPPRLYRKESALGSPRDGQHFHEAFEDGSYFADEFAKLAQGVIMAPSGRTSDGSTTRNGEPGTIQDGDNTSCTRRFRAAHTLTSEGMLRSVESVLVPYGSIMFACFSATYQQIMSSHHSQQGHRGTLAWASMAENSAIAASPPAVHTPPADGPARKRMKKQTSNPTSLTSSPRSGNSPPGNRVNNRESSPSARALPGGTASSGPTAKGKKRSGRADVGSGIDDNPYRAPSPPAPHRPRAHSGVGASPDHKPSSSIPSSDGLSAAAAAASLFADTHPETGEKRCTSCGTSNSPEWRKGPSGQKTLCNACGLRYSRAVSRQHKKDEKAKLAADELGAGDAKVGKPRGSIASTSSDGAGSTSDYGRTERAADSSRMSRGFDSGAAHERRTATQHTPYSHAVMPHVAPMHGGHANFDGPAGPGHPSVLDGRSSSGVLYSGPAPAGYAGADQSYYGVPDGAPYQRPYYHSHPQPHRPYGFDEYQGPTPVDAHRSSQQSHHHPHPHHTAHLAPQNSHSFHHPPSQYSHRPSGGSSR